MLNTCIVYMCSVFIVCVMAIEYSKQDIGIPKGFLSDCPGSTKKAIISSKSLKKLRISVLGPGNLLQTKLTRYNYHNAYKIAKDPDIDFKKKTMAYLGAYIEHSAFLHVKGMGILYKELGYNVLIIDYYDLIASDFPVAARLARPIGKHVGEILANLTSIGLDPKKLDLLGFSLGTQVSSFAAKKYREITGQNISSITALDPSGPCFRFLGPDQRLDPSDADHVLTIHTNIDGYGNATPLGHISIFVNGGEYQPGDFWRAPCGFFCSHCRAFQLWLSALINPGIFITIQCPSVQHARDWNCYDSEPRVTNTMDLFTDRSKPGVYYLVTFNRYPYGIGSKGLIKERDNFFMEYLGLLNADDVLVI